VSKTEKEIQTLGDVIDRNGGLVPVCVAAALCDVSKQRVHALCDSGRLRVAFIYGYRLVSVESLRTWRKSCEERRAS